MDVGTGTHGFREEQDPHCIRCDLTRFVSGFDRAVPEGLAGGSRSGSLLASTTSPAPPVSEEAKALIAHAADQNAHQSPDLFQGHAGVGA